MTGTNHALSGALIVGAIGSPFIAIPVAFASHFVLDALPHFGEKFGERHKLSKVIWGIDIVFLSIGLVVLLTMSSWLLIAGALAAMSPDFAWIYRFAVIEKWGTLLPTSTNKFNTWHASIQKYERRWGIWIEMPVLIILIVLNLKYTL